MGKSKDLNYNFSVQKDPKRPMGEGDFANMPSDPKFLKFNKGPEYRQGLPNSFVASVEDVSGIYENDRAE